MYQLVVFDMAGTTVYDDDFVHHALIKAMAVFGFEVDRHEANAIMGYPKPLAIRQMLQKRGANVALTDVIHWCFLEQMLSFYATDPQVKPAEGAQEVFERLRTAGIRVALNTGFSRDIAATIVERLSWQRQVDAWVASDMVDRGRPHPDMIRHLMHRLKVSDPAGVVKVGDTPVDIEEGRNAGVGLVLVVSNGAYSAEELSCHRPDYVVADLKKTLHHILPTS